MFNKFYSIYRFLRWFMYDLTQLLRNFFLLEKHKIFKNISKKSII